MPLQKESQIQDIHFGATSCRDPGGLEEKNTFCRFDFPSLYGALTIVQKSHLKLFLSTGLFRSLIPIKAFTLFIGHIYKL